MARRPAQRAAVMRKMSDDLLFDVEIVVVPTARESDGLAVGVRNREMTATQRHEAPSLSKALKRAPRKWLAGGVRSPRPLDCGGDAYPERPPPGGGIIYITICRPAARMEAVREVVFRASAVLALGAWVDESA